MSNTLAFRSTLRAEVIRGGIVEDLGVVSTKMVTTAFVEALVDALQAPVAAFSTYKYHDSGTGTTAAAIADTTLETPCAEARTTGTQTEGDDAYVYKSAATHTYAGTFTITEHGLFNAASGPTLMDRSVFAGIPMTAPNQIRFTYTLTCVAGG